MVKREKKGQKGNAAQYMTRTQAIRKLQLTLAEFRRLCIVKGIHPREPNKKTQGNNKTYYHVKDILFLAHEPLIHKYRESAIHERKIRKARAKRNEELARRLRARKPTYKLDHLVKERYPSFMDALRDLDDALTMIHLFATLPAEQMYRIPKSAVQISRRLALEWQAFIVRTNSLRKTFVTVKGFYYQAEIMGQNITWLVPHQLSQVLPKDVDYRVMLTFVEFYQTLLQFVNFKLYHTIGVKYPPVVDPKLEEAAAGLASIMQELSEVDPKPALTAGTEEVLDAATLQRLEGLQNKLHELQQESMAGVEADAEPQNPVTPSASNGQDLKPEQNVEREGEQNSEKSEDEGVQNEEGSAEIAERRESHSQAGALVPVNSTFEEARSLLGGAVNAEDDAEVCANLFSGMIFFLGREVPREQLLVVIRSFGGVVGWEGEGSPLTVSDERITHQIVDRPKQGHTYLGREYIQPQWVIDSANFRVLVDSRLYRPGVTPPPHLSPFVEADEEDYVPEYAQILQKMQASAKALRQKAAGVATDLAFLEDVQLTGIEKSPEDELAAAERQYTEQLTKELGKRKLAEEAEADSEEEEVAASETPGGEKASQAALDEDQVAMNKAIMKRKDRNLYQSILNHQAAKRQKTTKLQQKKAALQRPG